MVSVFVLFPSGGSEGIRTLVPLEAVTAFRVRAVMTTSIRFQVVMLFCLRFSITPKYVIAFRGKSQSFCNKSLFAQMAPWLADSDAIIFNRLFCDGANHVCRCQNSFNLQFYSSNRRWRKRTNALKRIALPIATNPNSFGRRFCGAQFCDIF